MGRIAGVTPEETRERLVDAAARVFELKGYEGATVAEIAREAGVTTGAIYTHYSGKAALLVEALRTHTERAMTALFPPGTRAGAADVLVTLGTRLAHRDPDEIALLVEALLASRRDAELAEVLAKALGTRETNMAAFLARAQERGAVSDQVSTDAAARLTLMLGLGSMVVAALDLPPTDPGEWDRLIRRLVGTLTQEDQP